MNSPEYRTCKRLIEAGRTSGMADKLAKLAAAGRITAEEKAELLELLKGE